MPSNRWYESEREQQNPQEWGTAHSPQLPRPPHYLREGGMAGGFLYHPLCKEFFEP